MSDIEIKAEVFRVVRNNSHKPKSAIMKAIKEHLPDISLDKIANALKEIHDEY